jgi:ribosomal protein S18 acetylase RimI-like enzyme
MSASSVCRAAKAMEFSIVPIAREHADSFRECLDTVAREGRYLALLAAPPMESVRGFVSENVDRGVPQVVALASGQVVGWCDILPGWPDALRHRGSVGMGVLPAHRGRGLGEALLRACLQRAAQAGITRVELEAREDNARALALYRRVGFRTEGVRVRGMRVDGEYVDTIAMALLLEPPR